MERTKHNTLMLLLAAMLLMVLMIIASQYTNPAPVGATAFTTPAAVPAMSTDNAKDPFYFWNSFPLTATGACTYTYHLQNYEVLDLQFIADATTANTTTVKLQYSNDNTNWADGATVFQNTGSDQNDIVQRYNVGAYTRLYATVTNSNPLTLTVIGIAK